MAKFRYVHCNFWRNADIFDFAPEAIAEIKVENEITGFKDRVK
jgi:hypothetical protein